MKSNVVINIVGDLISCNFIMNLLASKNSKSVPESEWQTGVQIFNPNRNSP